MIDLELAQVGINAEKGKELKQIDDEIKKLQQAKQELDEKKNKQQINNREYQNGTSKINDQISNLRTARLRVVDITDEAKKTNKELGKKVDKEVKVTDGGTAKAITDEAKKSVTKRVTLSAAWSGVRAGLSAALRGFSFPGFAKGTDYHPGGLSWVGEEGYELARLGNRWSMLNFGLMDIPRGTEIFTHDESKKILSALNNIPAYANGISRSGEANRVVGQLNNQSIGSPETINLLERIAVAVESGQSIQIEGREVMRATVRHFDEGLNNMGDRRKAAWGG